MYTIILRLLVATLVLTSASLHAESRNQARIVGGSALDIGAVPATVALLNASALAQSGSFFQSQFCGGTLIAPRWVLTAAHCLVEPDGSVPPANSLLVLDGSTDLESPVSQPIEVIRVIRHVGYLPQGDFGHDIALLELAYAASSPVAALDTQPVALNDTAFIAGWGALNEGGNGEQQRFPSRLQGAYVHMVPGDVCGALFSAYAGDVDGSQLCAGVAEGGVDACQGDSGGPLYRASADGRVISIAGITSWGIGCAGRGRPGIYTRVGGYLDWIAGYTGYAAPVPVATQPFSDPQVPVVTTSSSPLNGSANNVPVGAQALAGTGASGMALLPALLLFAWLRKRDADWYYRLVSLVGLGALSIGALLRHGEASPADPMELDLTQHALGQARAEVFATAERLWRSDGVCTIVKTGYARQGTASARTGTALALDRRAYFLETCSFVNTAANRICGASPRQAEYRFFEGRFIQFALEFETIDSPSGFRQCLDTLALADADLALSIDETVRATLSAPELVAHVPLLRDAP